MCNITFTYCILPYDYIITIFNLFDKMQIMVKNLNTNSASPFQVFLRPRNRKHGSEMGYISYKCFLSRKKYSALIQMSKRDL